MMKLYGIVSVALLFALAAGCTTREPGIYKQGGVFYETTDASVDEVSRATFAALREIPTLTLVTAEDPDAPQTQIQALNRYGTVVTVYIEAEGQATWYGVGVDPGENEGYSLTINNAIRRHLGQSERR